MDGTTFNLLVEKVRLTNNELTANRWKSNFIRKRKVDISSLCEKFGITIQDLAEICDVSMDVILEWQHGDTDPAGSASYLLWIAQRYPEVFLESLWEY